jgi:branched-chain amino acid transport system substrate-binding protein
MTQASKALDLPIKAVEWFNWNSKILDKLVNNTVAEGTECIALVANTSEGSQIVNAIANIEKGSRPKVFSHWGIVGGDFTKKVEQTQLAKVKLYYLNTIDFNQPKPPTGISWIKAFESKYGKHSGHDAFNGVAHAYDLVHLLALAIENAGSAESAKVRNALEQLGSFKGAMKTYTQPFTAANHEALDASNYIMMEFNAQGYGVVSP